MDNVYHRFDYQVFSTEFGKQVKIVHHRFDVIKKTPKASRYVCVLSLPSFTATKLLELRK